MYFSFLYNFFFAWFYKISLGPLLVSICIKPFHNNFAKRITSKNASSLHNTLNIHIFSCTLSRWADVRHDLIT